MHTCERKMGWVPVLSQVPVSLFSQPPWALWGVSDILSLRGLLSLISMAMCSFSFLAMYTKHMPLIQRSGGIRVHFLSNWFVTSSDLKKKVLYLVFYQWGD